MNRQDGGTRAHLQNKTVHHVKVIKGAQPGPPCHYGEVGPVGSIRSTLPPPPRCPTHQTPTHPPNHPTTQPFTYMQHTESVSKKGRGQSDLGVPAEGGRVEEDLLGGSRS